MTKKVEDKETKEVQNNQPGRSTFFCTVIMPLLVVAAAYFIFPKLMYKTTLGGAVDFANCPITRMDPVTGEYVLTNETVEIIPVNHDVKLIEAETAEGAIYAMGFLHGKERLWQLHFYRLLAQGRLSELLGPLGLQIDKHIRSVGIVRAAKDFIEHLDEEERHSVQMYTEGINKAVASMKVYPAEFYFFWTDFEDWTPLDSASIFYFLSYVLSQDAWNMMLRERLLEVYDRSLVERIAPFRPENYF